MKKTITILLFALIAASISAQPRNYLNIAQFTDNGELVFPDNIDRWIVMGASLGGDYSEEAFDAGAPPAIGVVQMEPTAYEYFLENGEYADGTMFYLTFYNSEAQSEPQLQGFVQGEVTAREIHLIDKSAYEDGRAFFLFAVPGQQSSAMLPAGNECVVCHTEHGQYNGTFTQFYPALRDHFNDGP